MPPVEEQYDPDGDLPVQGGIRGLDPGRLEATGRRNENCTERFQLVRKDLVCSTFLIFFHFLRGCFYHKFRSVLIEYQSI